MFDINSVNRKIMEKVNLLKQDSEISELIQEQILWDKKTGFVSTDKDVLGNLIVNAIAES